MKIGIVLRKINPNNVMNHGNMWDYVSECKEKERAHVRLLPFPKGSLKDSRESCSSPSIGPDIYLGFFWFVRNKKCIFFNLLNF